MIAKGHSSGIAHSHQWLIVLMAIYLPLGSCMPLYASHRSKSCPACGLPTSIWSATVGSWVLNRIGLWSNPAGRPLLLFFCFDPCSPHLHDRCRELQHTLVCIIPAMKVQNWKGQSLPCNCALRKFQMNLQRKTLTTSHFCDKYWGLHSRPPTKTKGLR